MRTKKTTNKNKKLLSSQKRRYNSLVARGFFPKDKLKSNKKIKW